MSWSKPASRLDLLNHRWRFTLDPEGRGEQQGWANPTFSKTTWRLVRVPGAWDFLAPEMRGYEGLGFYATDLPSRLIKKNDWQRLRFPRAFDRTKIWINGKLAGTNDCGFLPYTCDLTPFLGKSNAAHVVVACDNRLDPAHLPGGKVIEWPQYGGLHEAPELLTSGRVYLEALLLDPKPSKDRAWVRFGAQVRNTEGSAVEGVIHFSITCGSARLQAKQAFSCPAGATIEVKGEVIVHHPEWWSPERPVLYHAQADLICGGRKQDRWIERFGLRTIATRGRQILLNGQPVRLRGFCRYDDLPGQGWTVSTSQILADLRSIKRTGANVIRTHYPQTKEFYAAADQVGLMVMAEIPLCWWRIEWHGPWEERLETMDVIDKAEKALERLVAVTRNHPSVIIWSMGNEGRTNDSLGIAAMRRLMVRARALDSSRLVVFVTAGNVRGHDAVREADLVCANIYWGLFMGEVARDIAELKERTYQKTKDDVADMRKQYPDKPLVISEFGTHSLLGLRGEGRMTEDYQAAYLEAAHRGIVEADPDAGTIVWCWADYPHRRGFVGHGPMFPSDYGPYGVVTFDRKKKKALTTMHQLWKSSHPLR